MRIASALCTAAVLWALPSAVEAAGRHRLDLPGGRLGDALVALGRQAGISIGVSDSALAGRKVSPVRGVFTVEQALRRLLRGTGATFVMVDSGTIRIVRETVSRARPSRPSAAPRSRPRAAPAPAAVGEREVEEIIVTASRRETGIGSYPGAVTLIGGDDSALRDAIRGSEALVARLPGLASTHLGPGRNKLFIRGIADSSFTGPTQATVGQYLGETRLNYNAPDPDLRLYDLARVEILSGPQGTLYGAGSLGGIVRIVPNPPRPGGFEARASLGAASTRHGDAGFDAGAMLNLPLAAERTGLRLTGYAVSEGGYIDDFRRGLADVNRTQIVGGRAALRHEAGSGWTIDLSATAQSIRGEDAQFADRDGPPLTRRSAVRQNFGNDYGLGEAVATREWRDYRFVATAGIVRQVLRERYDATLGGSAPLVFDQVNRITLLSAESRLSRRAADGAGWLVGASVIRNRSEQSRAAGAPEAPAPIPGLANAILEATVYGEGSVRVGPGLTATAGGRLTHSRLSGANLDQPDVDIASLARTQAGRAETRFLPSAALAAKATPDLLFFLRYQQGYRPGGLAIAGNTVRRFRHDEVAAVEAGLRYGRPGESRFDAALSLAYTRWTDIQADIVDLGGRPTTANIGDGRIYTLDLKLGSRPWPGLDVELAAVFNDSRMTDRDSVIFFPAAAVAPSTLPNVARVNLRLGADYRTPLTGRLDLRLSGAARYVGKSRFGVGETFDEEQGNWLEIDLAGRLESARHAVTLTVANLLGAVGNRFALGSPFTFGEQRRITPLRPRTVRLGWQVRF